MHATPLTRFVLHTCETELQRAKVKDVAVEFGIFKNAERFGRASFLGAMLTALRGHVWSSTVLSAGADMCGCKHAHAKPWAWHPTSWESIGTLQPNRTGPPGQPAV